MFWKVLMLFCCLFHNPQRPSNKKKIQGNSVIHQFKRFGFSVKQLAIFCPSCLTHAKPVEKSFAEEKIIQIITYNAKEKKCRSWVVRIQPWHLSVDSCSSFWKDCDDSTSQHTNLCYREKPPLAHYYHQMCQSEIGWYSRFHPLLFQSVELLLAKSWLDGYALQLFRVGNLFCFRFCLIFESINGNLW